MLTYEYFCPTNGETLEVRHRISEKLSTWGELCERADADPGSTPLDTPIQRNILGGQLMVSKSGPTRGGMMQAAKDAAPKKVSGGCCHGGSCSH